MGAVHGFFYIYLYFLVCFTFFQGEPRLLFLGRMAEEEQEIKMALFSHC